MPSSMLPRSSGNPIWGHRLSRANTSPVRLHDEDRPMLAMHNEPPLGFQLLKGASKHEVWTRGLHLLLIRHPSTVTEAWSP